MIHSQSGVLNKILSDAPHSKLDLAKMKPSPHGDRLIGTIDSGTANLLNQLHKLSMKFSPSGQATPLVSTPSHPLTINVVQTSNPKGNK